MENNELKDLFIKFNNQTFYQRNEEYFNIINKIYEILKFDKDKIIKTLEISEEKVLLKSIYLIEFYNVEVLKKPINNLLYFILEDSMLFTTNIKKDYINQAQLLIKSKEIKK